MMKTYKICLTVTTTTSNYIEIEADSEESAEMEAMRVWYEDDRAFSSKLRDETVDDVQVLP